MWPTAALLIAQSVLKELPNTKITLVTAAVTFIQIKFDPLTWGLLA